MTTSRPLRVAVDAVAAQQGGGLTFLLGQLPHLEQCADLTVFANPEVAGVLNRELVRSEVKTLPVWSRKLPIRLVWENFVLPHQISDYDVLYSVGGLASIGTRKPQVVVVQSAYMFGPAGIRAIRHADPPFGFRFKLLVQRTSGHLTLRLATVLITTSEFIASQVHTVGGTGLDLRVVPIAGAPLSDQPVQCGEPLPTSKPFALSVGSDAPHKDRLGLLRNWPHDAGIDLVLIGHSHQRKSSMRLDKEVAARPDVHWLGPVFDRGRLSQLYGAASMVVAHSYLEGFGMTTLEALESETPVIASDIPGHREVCGDAAIYYDPADKPSLAAAVRRLLADEDLRKQLVDAGRKRAEQFAWRKSAEATYAILLEAHVHAQGA